MMSSTLFDQQLERIEAGDTLAPDNVRELAEAADILPLGMLADAMRRRLHGVKTTYLRVAVCRFDAPFADAVLPAAREVRIAGQPPSLEAAVSAVQAARTVAGDRTVSGLSWADVMTFSDAGTPVGRVLRALHEAGLDALAELPLDAIDAPDPVIGQLANAGFERLRITVDKMAGRDRVDSLLRVADWHRQFGGIVAINPLPTALNAFRPTTGYEDVKMVAVARLAAPAVAHVQVDWQLYGPKLAQVALTFGADDVDGVSAVDDSTEGRRRAPREEIRRNIQAAGFEPVERDGRFAAL
jgi:aminodeoxyfutalosine synthase